MNTNNARNLAHDFGVKFNPCMYSHVSCPGWRNGWHNYVFISAEDLATYMLIWLKQSQ